MISITCTNCKSLLTIDDAFAGGVCRCQHCGTIQTVPAAGSGGKQTALKEPKTLYQNPARSPDATGTGLDDLANVVASSGLGSGIGSGLPHSESKSSKPVVNNRIAILLGIAGGIIAMLVVVLMWLLMRSPDKANPNAKEYPQPENSPSPNVVVADAPPKSLEPEFCGVKLAGANTIVYVLDRGSGTQNYFSGLKEACFASIASIGSDRKFEIIFWDNGSGDTAYPENSSTFATKDNLEAAHRALEDVYAFGQTDAKSAMQKAFARNPDVIILATGKAWDLDENFAKMIDEVRKTSAAKIHTFALGEAGSSNVLRSIASKSGGQFKEISEGQLKSFSK